jgi:hypothetical protein
MVNPGSSVIELTWDRTLAVSEALMDPTANSHPSLFVKIDLPS